MPRAGRRPRRRSSGRRQVGVRVVAERPYGEPRAPSTRFLPPDPAVEAPYRLTPGLAFRVGILGFVALAVFAVLFFRLWSLQVLSGDTYLAAAQGNQLRTIRIEAPRGTILDRRGRVDRRQRRRHGGEALGRRPPEAWQVRRDQAARRGARSSRRPSREGGRRADRRPDQPDHRQDRGRRGSGRVPLRAPGRVPGRPDPADLSAELPVRPLGAQMLGYVGEVSQDELDGRPKLYRPGDKVGKAGVEARLDEHLRGAGRAGADPRRLARPPPGAARGAPRGAPGNAVRLTIDMTLQRAAERALAYGIGPPRERVVLRERRRARRARPADGAVLAMASTPTYKPSVYVGRVDPKKIQPLVNDGGGEEGTTRASTA